MNQEHNPFADFEVISSYSRAQAIEDGFLVDVSETCEARELGFKFPIALTRCVYDKYVEVPPGAPFQDKRGRLWDVLYMLVIALRQQHERPDRILYKLHVSDGRPGIPPLVTLLAVCGPGDDPRPVITIMEPDED